MVSMLATTVGGETCHGPWPMEKNGLAPVEQYQILASCSGWERFTTRLLTPGNVVWISFCIEETWEDVSMHCQQGKFQFMGKLLQYYSFLSRHVKILKPAHMTEYEMCFSSLPIDYLFNHMFVVFILNLFKLTALAKKNKVPYYWPFVRAILCVGESTNGFPAQKLSNVENASMLWHHHGVIGMEKWTTIINMKMI